MGTQSFLKHRYAVARYGLAILATAIALLLRELLRPLMGNNNPYHTLWPAVVLMAWYGGIGASALTTFLGLLGVWYWFLPPFHSFTLLHPKAQISGMVGFVVFSSLIIALGEANRRSKKRSEREIEERTRTEQDLRERERELQAAHTGLENRVRERTAELDAANKSLQQLSVRLLQLQDEERRRLARELHDSVGQLLAALSMNISMMQSTPLGEAVEAALAENAKLVDQISSEIRTMSHLLHPPLLDDVGLASALRWYVEGFSNRSKIEVALEIAGEFGRLPSDMEIAIFRIVQECLTNVHRHSGSRSAQVGLTHDCGRIRVEIKDAGKGIPLEKAKALSSSGRMGVGFRGMRERVAELGGTLEIESDERGSTVRATMPVPKLPAAPTADGVIQQGEEVRQ
jgi:signal transduction histidine kinase